MKIRKLPHDLYVVFLLLIMSGCANLDNTIQIENRLKVAQILAKDAQLDQQILITQDFTFLSFASNQKPSEVVTIYIEGDGHAWENTHTPSQDPTPKKPISLELAALDTSFGVAYLARACQYQQITHSDGCTPEIWTSARFSPKMVRNLNEAIDQLKQHYQAKKIVLIGYSGGATLALLCAAGRQDVSQVITVAGNLDTLAWTEHHKLSPLTGSLNPADFSQALQPISQTHFIGQNDMVIPFSEIQSYLGRFKSTSDIQVIAIEDYTHECCWSENWKALINQYRK
jgi:poly(3-hydroxybutyrate) depolymerase